MTSSKPSYKAFEARLPWGLGSLPLIWTPPRWHKHAKASRPSTMAAHSTSPDQMSDTRDTSLAITLFSEIIANEQLIRNLLGKVLPKGMEVSHFSVLNQLARAGGERSPAQLAKSFHVTRGAMTNTLGKLEMAGYVHIRPDWDDARRKMVAISPSGRAAWEAAMSAIAPMIAEQVSDLGEDSIRTTLPVLRALRRRMQDEI